MMPQLVYSAARPASMQKYSQHKLVQPELELELELELLRHGV